MSDGAVSRMRTEEYQALVKERKECRLCACAGLRNPAMPELVQLDSDEIGPWTRWLGDRTAELMIIGEDWGDVDYYRKHNGFDDDRVNSPANRRLKRLLNSIEMSIPSGERRDEPSGVFLTNALLCLKSGGLQGKVDPRCFVNCQDFLRRQIEIISPRVVVTLGKRAYDAVVSSFELEPRLKFGEAVKAPDGLELESGCRLLPVYHCGNRSTNLNRPEAEQLRDWKRVRRALRRGIEWT